MGWSRLRLDTYYQTALNLMPITRAIPASKPEPFYTAIIEALTEAPSSGSDSYKPLFNRLPDDEHKTHIVIDSIGESSLAVFDDENRWTSAYLLDASVRPANLKVVANAIVDRVSIESTPTGDSNQPRLTAKGVEVEIEGQRFMAQLAHDGGEIALTSGAFGNTGILQRSGVGPGSALQAAGIEVLVDNPEVGHGVDHHEIAVMYEWREKWNSSGTGGRGKALSQAVDGHADGAPSRGGVMGWPFMVFASFLPEHRFLYGEDQQQQLSTFMNAHFGAGYAEPYTDFPSVVCTPNCIQPDLKEGYRAFVTSSRPQ